MLSKVQQSRILSLLFLNDEAAIGKYKSETEALFIRANIIEQIATITGMLNVGKNLSAPQIEILAGMILEDANCKELTPSEIAECLKEGIKGSFGKIYDRIDVAIVFEWLNAYMNKRIEALHEFRQAQANEFKGEMNKPYTSGQISDVGQKVIDNLKKRLEPIKQQSKQISAEVNKEQAAQQKLSKEIFAEFDELLKTSDFELIGTPPEPFIKYNGKMVNRFDFHNIRWAEINEQSKTEQQ